METLAVNGAAATPSDGAGDRIVCREPATRRPLPDVAIDGEAAVRDAVERARAAQPSLARAPFGVRRRVLERILAHVVDHADELCELVCRVSGKTRENAMVGEIWPVAEKLRWTIAQGERHLKPERVSSGLLLHKRATIEYAPRGVIGAIVPWNYPLQNVMNPVVPSLMAGNGVVVKPSEWVAAASARLQRITDEALAAEGLPVDLVRLVNGYGATGAALIDSGIDAVIFIGSVPNGRRVAEAAARALVPAILELGGKDPMIVCDDAHLEQAVHAALAGCFINCGQNCVASERILVQSGIYDRFERRVAEMVGALRQGAPLDGAVIDVGAMTTPLQRQLVERLVARAVEQGARVIAGGTAVLRDRGDYFAPTILADVTPAMEIMQEEAFGPVMLLCRVRDDDEAVAIANSTRFGLSSTVLSRDRRRAARIARRLASGMTAVNEFGGVTYMVQDLPFGGVKESGHGRLNGRDGLRALTQPRAIVEDRLPIHIPSRIFPVGARDYDTTHSVVELLYGPGLARRWRGLKGLLRGRRRP